MARGDEELSSQLSIDHLRSLSDRPNVESTIILSRNDGSIIRSSGFSAVEKRRRARSLAAHQALPGEHTEQSGPGSSSEQTEEISHSPAEELAVSILQCVQAADSLGSLLAALSSEEESEEFASRKSGSERSAPESERSRASLSDESAVQLLRLRVKQHRRDRPGDDIVVVYPVLPAVGDSESTLWITT
ncbi:hypothetical protein DV736_g2538, partial [Chaetothyriales sp. CBS 134916]